MTKEELRDNFKSNTGQDYVCAYDEAKGIVKVSVDQSFKELIKEISKEFVETGTEEVKKDFVERVAQEYKHCMISDFRRQITEVVNQELSTEISEVAKSILKDNYKGEIE